MSPNLLSIYNPSMYAEDIIKVYTCCSKIEVIFREIKQQLEFSITISGNVRSLGQVGTTKRH